MREATDAYLGGVTANELDRSVTVNDTEMPVAVLLTMMVCHSAGHAGDIAAVKGVQGLKGLPR